MAKSLPAVQELQKDTGSIPGLGRSLGGRHGNPLQYSCLENPMDRGAWQATVHRVAELDTTEVTYHAHMHTIVSKSAGAQCPKVKHVPPGTPESSWR